MAIFASSCRSVPKSNPAVVKATESPIADRVAPNPHIGPCSVQINKMPYQNAAKEATVASNKNPIFTHKPPILLADINSLNAALVSASWIAWLISLRAAFAQLL